MTNALKVYRTSIGCKAVMAVTGLLLYGFVIAHLLGNLQVFQGRDAINAYAHWLQEHARLLWVARGGLLLLFVVHIATAIRLTLMNRNARPESYHREDTLQASWASRHMFLTGALLLAFTVCHLLHFTLHVIDTGGMEMLDTQARPDVYGMMIDGFTRPLVAGSYVVAMLLLGLHLLHGGKSLFQSLGLNHESINPLVSAIMPALAVFVVAGNLLIPLAILMGFLS